jgi:hypothetical protein
MEFAVALQYPNGRTYETVLSFDGPLERGTEFERYGHTWRVADLLDSSDSDEFRRRV